MNVWIRKVHMYLGLINFTLLVLFGLGIGLVGVVVSIRFLESLIVGAGRLETTTVAFAALLLAASALVASFVPARRAARVDPIAALREN